MIHNFDLSETDTGLKCEPVLPGDLELIQAQLHRTVRNVVGIAARCVCSRPTVVVTSPRLDDGSPFPTLYYLTHPAATAALSALESQQAMVEYSALLEQNEHMQIAYQKAHDSYIAARESLGVVDEIHDISAGGMPVRIKCLHALAAHALAVGSGVNPIGDLALEAADWSPKVCACRT